MITSSHAKIIVMELTLGIWMKIFNFGKMIFCCSEKPLHARRLRALVTFRDGLTQFTFMGHVKMVFPDSTNTLAASVKFVDAAGQAATVVGVPVWQLTGDPIGDLVVAGDGLSAVLTLNHSLGTAQVAITAEGDPVAGVDTVHVTGDLQIVAGEAVSGSVSFVPA